jgi:MFS family permease
LTGREGQTERGGTEPVPRLWPLWFGQVVSLFGSALTLVVLPLYAVLGLDTSAAKLSVISLCGAVPMMLAPFYAGPLADRLSRGLLMCASNALSGLILVSLPLVVSLGWMHWYSLALINALLAVGGAVFASAFFALIPDLVHESMLPTVNGRYASASTIAQAVGVALSGLFMRVIGFVDTMLIDGATFLIASACLPLTPVLRGGMSRGQARAGAWGAQYINDVVGGFRALARLRPVRTLMISTSLFNFFFGALSIDLIIYLARVCLFSSSSYAAVMTTGMVGAALGGLCAKRIIGFLDARYLFVAAILVAGLSAAIFPVVQGHSLGWVALAGLPDFLISFAVTVYATGTSTTRQRLVPAELRGRISAITNAGGRALLPLGAVLAGLATDAWGSRLVLCGVAAGWCTVACFLLQHRRELSSPQAGMASGPGGRRGLSVAQLGPVKPERQ